MPYAGVAGSIETAGEAEREKCPLQFLGEIADGGEPSQSLRRAGALVGPILLGEVLLGVVVRHESVVCINEFLEALRPGEVEIRYPPLDAERRLDEGLPRLMLPYLGSLALSNGFDVAAHLRPSRQWWMFLVRFFGVVFYATNVINYLGTFLAIAGVLTNTWLLIILADYFVCRRWMRLGRMEGIEFRKDELRAWNPCGLIFLGVAVAVGALGILGVYPTYYVSFLAMILGPLLHVAITAATKGRYYEPAHASANRMGDNSGPTAIPRRVVSAH